MPDYGAYTLNLYCDNEDAHRLGEDVNYEYAGGFAQYITELGSRARRLARKNGWIVGRKRVLCPLCAKAINKQKETR